MELFTMLVLANKAGLGVGGIVGLVTIYFMLKNQQKKFYTDQKIYIETIAKGMSENVDKIVGAIGVQNARLETLEEDMRDIKKKIELKL